VTHDIDEAIKMGDRIAIMRDGHLIQMAPADELLAKPVNEFVASFVGADRGLKRLRVRTLDEIELEPAPSDGPGRVPVITRDNSLHNALSLMLAEGTTQLAVTDADGTVVGGVRLETITHLIAPADEAARA
jgi:osmoprotectant transport system ATP-binding protein